MTMDNPADPATKSIRIVAGKALDVTDPNKRAIALGYENAVKKLYVRSHYAIQMPSTAVAIPEVTKSNADWQAAYANEKIKIIGNAAFSASGRSDFELEGDLNHLLIGVSDPDAQMNGEFFRTEEQGESFSHLENDATEHHGE